MKISPEYVKWLLVDGVDLALEGPITRRMISPSGVVLLLALRFLALTDQDFREKISAVIGASGFTAPEAAAPLACLRTTGRCEAHCQDSVAEMQRAALNEVLVFLVRTIKVQTRYQIRVDFHEQTAPSPVLPPSEEYLTSYEVLVEELP